MINSWEYFNPVKIRAGQGNLLILPKIMHGTHWLLLTTKGSTNRGITAKVKELVSNIDLEVCDQITPNPELGELEAITANYKHKKFDGILAIGGGSIIDAAKVLALTIPSNIDNVLTVALSQKKIFNWLSKLQVFAIPTTSGTGAEVTPFATVWDNNIHKKYSLEGDHLYPDLALLDPELTISLPKKETLYTGLDAISHALESLWNVNRTPISQAFAIQSLELAEKAFPIVLTNPANILAREIMQLVSVLGGLAISQTRSAIAHSISYPLTSYFKVPHGLACSFTLPIIIDYYLEHCEGEIAEDLMIRIKNMLANLDLQQHISTYLTKKELLSLKEKMFHPDRMKNFTGTVNIKILDKILSSHY